MFKRSSVTPIFVVFLIVACFDGLFFARAANVVLDKDNKEGNVVTQQADIEFTLVLRSDKFYRDKTQPKKLTLDVGDCILSIERQNDQRVRVKVGGSSDDYTFLGNIFDFTIKDDKKLKIRDENFDDPTHAYKLCDVNDIQDKVIPPEKFVTIRLEDDIAPELFLYAPDIRLGVIAPPALSTDASSTTLATTDASSTTLATAETSPPSSECLSNPVYIAIGAAAGLVGALAIVGIVSLICFLVKKKRSAEKVVVKDVSVRNEKTKETTVDGEKSAFKDVTDNKSAYGTSVEPSPVTPSLL